MVLDFFSFEKAEDFFRNYRFQGMEPFTMVIVERGKLWELRWDETKKSIEQLLEYVVQNQLNMWEVVSGKAKRPPLPSNARNGLDRLVALVKDVRLASKNQTLVDTTRSMIEAINYRGEIERLYSDPNERDSRWAVVEQIVNAMGEYEQSSRQPNITEFLDRLLLGDQDTDSEKEKQLKQNAIALMTLHSAKGLEFPEVYMVGLEEGILPHHRSLQDDEAGVPEERRLCYVGVTRAEEKLTLSMSLTRMKWGKPRDTLPSRCLYEMTGKADHPNYVKRRKGIAK